MAQILRSCFAFRVHAQNSCDINIRKIKFQVKWVPHGPMKKACTHIIHVQPITVPLQVGQLHVISPPHFQCIDSLEKETLGNLDLILKWCTIRFCDTNPSMINKALDYLQRLFAHLADIDFSLSDLDANSFIPYLVLKVREGCVCV